MTTDRKWFTKVPDWLIESDLPLHEFVVLLALMKHNRTENCEPGFATIGREARVSRDTVKRALRSLEDRGLIEIEQRRVGAKNLTNHYTLHVEPERVGAHSTHSKGSQTSGVGARSTQVGAHSTQGVGADSTPNKRFLLTRGSERDGASSSDIVSAVESRHAPSVIVLDIDGILDRVWAHWPNKRARKIARARFEIAARRHPRGLDGLVDDVIAHGRAYQAHTPVEFVPMLSTWLNGDRWDDPLPSPRRGGSVADQNMAMLSRYLGPDGDSA